MEEQKGFSDVAIAESEAREIKADNKATDYDNYSLEEQEAIRFGQDTKHRNWLVIWMMIVVGVWLMAVLLFSTFNNAWCLNISDNVLITLLATTTINVLGLSKIILGGLFGNRRYYRRNK